MAKDLIRYDLLVQDALRGLFRRVLGDVAQHGLPGDHHFYVTFKTSAPGVEMSPRLLNAYPEQMTISLQHQFWDLRVDDSKFEVGLSFSNIPERLSVPFAAVTAFFDPSVNFGAEFTVETGEENQKPEAAAKPAPIKAAPVAPADDAPEAAKSAQTTSEDAKVADVKPAEEGAPNVVSIDAFRKKH
jgi:hypothetical protein